MFCMKYKMTTQEMEELQSYKISIENDTVGGKHECVGDNVAHDGEQQDDDEVDNYEQLIQNRVW